MTLCHALHRDNAGIYCNRPGVGPSANHEYHSGLDGDSYVDWLNDNYRPAQTGHSRSSKERLKEMASKVAPETRSEVRHFIPDTSTRLGRVALYLIDHLGTWVGIDELTASDVGGSSAVNWVNRLITFGWPIDTKRSNYRLREDPRQPLWKQGPS